MKRQKRTRLNEKNPFLSILTNGQDILGCISQFLVEKEAKRLSMTTKRLYNAKVNPSSMIPQISINETTIRKHLARKYYQLDTITVNGKLKPSVLDHIKSSCHSVTTLNILTKTYKEVELIASCSKLDTLAIIVNAKVFQRLYYIITVLKKLRDVKTLRIYGNKPYLTMMIHCLSKQFVPNLKKIYCDTDYSAAQLKVASILEELHLGSLMGVAFALPQLKKLVLSKKIGISWLIAIKEGKIPKLEYLDIYVKVGDMSELAFPKNCGLRKLILREKLYTRTLPMYSKLVIPESIEYLRIEHNISTSLIKAFKDKNLNNLKSIDFRVKNNTLLSKFIKVLKVSCPSLESATLLDYTSEVNEKLLSAIPSLKTIAMKRAS